MYRLVVFENGGTVKFDKNASTVPTSIVNELIVHQCIDSTRLESQAQLRLGKAGDYTARMATNAENGTNVALLYPASLRLAGPDSVVADVSKIYASVDDMEKFKALVEVRLKNFTSSASNNSASIPITTTPNAATNSGATASSTEKTSDAKSPASTSASGETSGTASTRGIKGKRQRKTKKKRTWDGQAASDSDNEGLDYSELGASSNTDTPVTMLNALDLGTKSKQGFMVKELSNELGEILNSENPDLPANEPFGFLKKFVGGKKLDDNDLKSVLNAMEDHLVNKNVAKEVAVSICEQVRKDLVGTSTGNWTTVKSTVRQSIKRALSRILTPSSSTDLLAGIKRKSANGAPFVISVVGVNGVGKSTNLGKLGFWFLQNDFKVLVAACDTFRSGAVEQLKVHVQRLQQMKGTKGEIELYDQGYGKDAAVIAKRAVEHAAKHHFDVVLIDTAGRRHNDDRLMSSLEKFGNLANPDKIIMVGEALVGTDSVEQARNFDAAFGKNRRLDFFLISKCDTVGEMLGTLVNVTYATGVPVLFVGVGQQYTDLRTLSVDWAVDKLLG